MSAEEDVLDSMLAMPGAEHEFVMQRAIEAQARDGIGVGMSPEAMEALQFSMTAWVGTRLLRFNKERGAMPQTVKVVVTVEMEL